MVLKFMFCIYSKITVVKKKIESYGDDEKETTKNMKKKVNNKMKIKIKYALYAYALLSFKF